MVSKSHNWTSSLRQMLGADWLGEGMSATKSIFWAVTVFVVMVVATSLGIEAQKKDNAPCRR